MNKLRIKYNIIKTKISVKTRMMLALSREKINSFIDIEKDHLKNTLVAITLIFLGSFSFMVVIIAKHIEKEMLSMEVIEFDDGVNQILKGRVEKLTSGHPIEEMSRYIAQEDEDVAAFLVAIAKKESNWGERTPKLNGQECYNYWGFRQKRERMGSGGHTCFDNPKDAVRSVADRIEDLMEKDVNTPEKMVVWKCGYSCDGHNSQSVQKWINDVKLYYNKL